MRFLRLLIPVAAAGVVLSARTTDAQTTTLRGSRAAVDRTYRKAVEDDLVFHHTGSSVRSSVKKGTLVRLRGNSDYRVHGVNYPYALPTTVTFVKRLAEQYRDSCGEKMVVTSAVRPRSFRLINSVDKSVHPAGMAVDIRKPARRRCLSWLRDRLLYLERQGVLDATEENRPPHFHVAVFPDPYLRYLGRVPRSEPVLANRDERPARVRTPAGSSANRPAGGRTYRVRPGDSLWVIARRHGTSVARIKAANSMRSSRIRVGQVLVIPAGR
ncbi:MAG TPA: DUF5715 family protein [Longimicrobiaceae bacterium]|nr:DUF5715 family protein [Longimicrobiaceae bacterium]